MDGGERITRNPAHDLAGRALKAGQAGPIRDFLRAAAKEIGSTHGGMSKEQRIKAMSMLALHPAAIAEAAGMLQMVSDLHKRCMTKKPLVPNCATQTDVTFGVPELYPVGKARGTGPAVESLEEAEKHPGVYSYDVVQQTDVVNADVDSVNVVTTVEAQPSVKAPTGVWAEATEDIKERVDWVSTDPKRGVVLEMKEEDIVITLEKRTESLHDDATGRIAGQRVHTAAGTKMDISQTATDRSIHDSRLFRKTGIHSDVIGYNLVPDAVTVKVDGEALQIVSGTGKPLSSLDGGKGAEEKELRAYAVTRNGSTWKASIEGRYEHENRTPRIVRMTVEMVPSVRAPQRAFLVDADAFGVGNAQGMAFLAELVKKKRVRLVVDGAALPLELACMCTVPPDMADGIVLHSKRRQSFVKGLRSVDLAPGVEKEQVRKTWPIVEGPDGVLPGVSEYTVERNENGEDRLVFKRERKDKTHPNRLTNILSLMGQTDAYAVAECVGERVGVDFKRCVHERYDVPGRAEHPIHLAADRDWLLSYTWELSQKCTSNWTIDDDVPGRREMMERELRRLEADEGFAGPLDDPHRWYGVSGEDPDPGAVRE